MKVTFLEAKVPLTKTFNMVDGELVKIGHPKILDVKSYVEEFETLEELAELLKRHGDTGRCMLKGNLTRQLDWESRRGSTDPNDPTRLVCYDVDGLPDVSSADQFMQLIGLGGTDYVAQYSASSGVVPGRGLSCHIFTLLDRAAAPALLKQVLVDMNLTVPGLRANMKLSRTNSALRWPLDISTCQNDKLIYIAPPILGEGVEDSFAGERITFVRKDSRTMSLAKAPNTEKNRTESQKVLNQLRFEAGLPERKRDQYRMKESVEYLANPDRATITEIKTERGFVYMNLNGGDSWGYFHPENNPEFIDNFKGEPKYKTSELLPEYWAEVKSRVAEVKPDEDGKYYLAFRDFRTATYWNAIYDSATDALKSAQAKSENQLRNFLMSNGQPVPDYVSDWDVAYDPHSELVVDPTSKWLNIYRPSDYRKAYKHMTDEERDVVKDVPPTIRRVLMHAMGDDPEAYDHFINWLAVALQTRDRTQTCWVWHGIQGTGKGLMLNQVLRPMFGASNITSKRMEELDSDFNGFLERCQLLFVDEAQLSAFNRGSVIEGNLKNYVVEPFISVRHMFQLPFEVHNYLNIIFASNKPDPVTIDPSDRRFNVATFQPQKLQVTDEEVAALEVESWEFFCYLMRYGASKARARTTLNNSAKQLLINIGIPSLDVAVHALKTGDLQFFYDQMPTGPVVGFQHRHSADAYKALVNKLKDMRDLTRDEVFVLVNHVVGDMHAAPGKFAGHMKHHNLHFQSIRRDGKVVRGIKVEWKI